MAPTKGVPTPRCINFYLPTVRTRSTAQIDARYLRVPRSALCERRALGNCRNNAALQHLHEEAVAIEEIAASLHGGLEAAARKPQK